MQSNLGGEWSSTVDAHTIINYFIYHDSQWQTCELEIKTRHPYDIPTDSTACVP